MNPPQDLTTARHPAITWTYGPLQFAHGDGMVATIGVFRVEVLINLDRPVLLYIPQVGIDGKPIATDVNGLPSGGPAGLERLLDRCVGFLRRRLESALEDIGG